MHGNVSINGPLGRKLHAQGYRTPAVDKPLWARIADAKAKEEAAQRAAAQAKAAKEQQRRVAVERVIDLLRAADDKFNPRSRDRRDVALAKAHRAEVASRHGLTLDDLDCNSRRLRIIYARHEAIYLIIRDTLFSFPRVGRMFGGRDHTTILHAVRKHAERNKLPLPRGLGPSLKEWKAGLSAPRAVVAI